MRQRRPILSFASFGIIAFLLAFVMVGCGGSSGGGGTPTTSTVTLTYWYTEGTSETPVILQLIQQFQQQNPNIKINAEYKPFGQTQSAFATAAQAGKAPDILRSDVGWVTQFASLRYLLPIDQYTSQSDLSDYLSAPLSYDKYNGHLYGLPQVTDPSAARSSSGGTSSLSKSQDGGTASKQRCAPEVS